jgi:shikimate dehydrogenase
LIRLALLGDPVDHSLSPVLQNAALAATGLEGTYQARRVDEVGLSQAFADLRAGRLHGFNVTMPHKAAAAARCDRLEGDAAQAGSVNTVSLEAGEVVGRSTDTTAIADSWNGLAEVGPILILGAGGAAVAAVTALRGRRQFLSARRFGAGRELAEHVSVDLGELRWGAGVVGAVLVNCTPLGMKGESLPAVPLGLASGLLDLAYGAETTPAVADMRRTGRPAVDGRTFLLAQAANSFTIWTGLPAPTEDMLRALENHSRQPG